MSHCQMCDGTTMDCLPCPGCQHEAEIARLTATVKALEAERDGIKARALTTINGFKADNIALRDALAVVTAERDELLRKYAEAQDTITRLCIQLRIRFGGARCS